MNPWRLFVDGSPAANIQSPIIACHSSPEHRNPCHLSMSVADFRIPRSAPSKRRASLATLPPMASFCRHLLEVLPGYGTRALSQKL